MNRGRAEDIIDQACALGARWVSFTGGEPFLERWLLLNLVAYASRRGLYTEAVTNCNWAKSQAQAVETLRPLAEAGLTALNMSVDGFHQEQIPLERVRHCFEAAKELGLKPVFMVATWKDSAITAGTLPALMGDQGIQVMGEPRKPHPSALAMETPFTPVGRGARVEAANRGMGAATIRCGAVLADIGVTPGGDVLPCCGPLACREDAAIGNVEDEPLREILTRARHDGRFTRILEGFDAGSGYASRCDACYKLFGRG
jgi:MoaA/NifB/PqqE/SkfB family radical SAM enzyme